MGEDSSLLSYCDAMSGGLFCSRPSEPTNDVYRTNAQYLGRLFPYNHLELISAVLLQLEAADKITLTW